MKVTIKVGKHSTPIPKGAAERIAEFLTAAGFDYEVTVMLGQRVYGAPHLHGVRVVKIASQRGVQLRVQPGDNDTAYMYVVPAPPGMNGADFFDRLRSVECDGGEESGSGQQVPPPPFVFSLLPVDDLLANTCLETVALQTAKVAEEAMALDSELEKQIAVLTEKADQLVDAVHAVTHKLTEVEEEVCAIERELAPLQEARTAALAQLRKIDEQIEAANAKKRLLKSDRNRLMCDVSKKKKDGRETTAELERLRGIRDINLHNLRGIRDDLAGMLGKE